MTRFYTQAATIAHFHNQECGDRRLNYDQPGTKQINANKFPTWKEIMKVPFRAPYRSPQFMIGLALTLVWVFFLLSLQKNVRKQYQFCIWAIVWWLFSIYLLWNMGQDSWAWIVLLIPLVALAVFVLLIMLYIIPTSVVAAVSPKIGQ
jgi:hypothetical protein